MCRPGAPMRAAISCPPILATIDEPSELGLAFHQPEVGARMLAETHDVLDAGRPGQPGEQLPARIVAIDQRRAALLHALEDLGLGRGDLVEIAEVAEMRGGDQRDDGDMRPHHLHQRPDLARMVHADLEDRVVAILQACAPASAARPNDC